ncbi:MAG: hypothetical protein YFSK_2060 [Candidatus Yanofskyibacterium parasiticum]|nr:MAG: hypothetical protein YFSK_2060 [Candidatus Yanofskybacteria bacterium]
MNTIYKNEQIKRRFYKYLKNSKGFSEDTVRSYEKSIWVWEDFTNKADFGGFSKRLAGAFKEWFKNKKKTNSQENISISYCYDVLRFLKVFFDWLSKQAGYKSKINQTEINYLNLTRKEIKEATQPKNVKSPTFDELKTTIESIKGRTEIEMRDKALFSLALMTGARITAIRTLSIQCFDKSNLVLYQDPAFGVETKFSKKIVSVILPFSY